MRRDQVDEFVQLAIPAAVLGRLRPATLGCWTGPTPEKFRCGPAPAAAGPSWRLLSLVLNLKNALCWPGQSLSGASLRPPASM